MGFTKKVSHLGFTLNELLITIAVISILAAVVIGNLGSQQKKARDAKRKADLGDIRNSLQLYYNDNGFYSDSNTGAAYSSTSTGAQPWISGLTTSYIKQVPVDPKNSGTFVYRYDTPVGHASYYLSADLENNSDPQRSANCNPNYATHDYCLTNP